MESRRASESDHGEMDLGPPVILFLREGGLHLRHRGIEGVDLAVRDHAAAHVRHQDDGQGTGRRDGEFLQAGHFYLLCRHCERRTVRGCSSTPCDGVGHPLGVRAFTIAG